jgi:hypothetical protein
MLTVKQINDREQLKGNWTNKCPMCNQTIDRGEDELHLMLFCKRWTAARKEYLLPLVKEGQQKRKSEDNKVQNNLPLVEDKLDIYMMIIGGSNTKYSLLEKEKVLIEKQQWTWYTANFLQSISSERKTILDTLWQEYGIVKESKAKTKSFWNSEKKIPRRRSKQTEENVQSEDGDDENSTTGEEEENPTPAKLGANVKEETYDPDMILFQTEG